MNTRATRTRSPVRKGTSQTEKPEVKETVDPNTSMQMMMLEMLKTMQEQNAISNQLLAKVLENRGTSIKKEFTAPPSEITVESDMVLEDSEIDSRDHGPRPAVTNEYLPGAVIPDGYTKDGIPYGKRWRAWKKQDLNPEDTHTFVPFPVPGLVWPERDEEGRQKILLNVNGLECWLTVGEMNTCNKFFYNAYQDCYNGWKEAENFKRVGGRGPWMAGGKHGENTWAFTPEAQTFGITDDGRPIGAAEMWRQIFAEADAYGTEITQA